MRKMIFAALLAIALCGAAGCATSFTGSAYIEGGRSACEQKCKGEGMQVAGMVYMGEYSSACVCEVPRAAASASNDRLLGTAAGASGASAGVVMQMRRSQQQASHAAVPH